MFVDIVSNQLKRLLNVPGIEFFLLLPPSLFIIKGEKALSI
jgi:hypothetical protein